MNLELEYQKQITAFADLDNDIKEYAAFKPRGKKVLVKLFRMKLPKASSKLNTSSILVPSKLEPGEYVTVDEAKADKIFPIVKVLAKGPSAPDDLEVGNLYNVTYNDIVGEVWNPDFLFFMQNFVKTDKGMGLANLPKDMRQRKPKIEVEWERYKFSKPSRVGKETDEDQLVYLIPELKIESEYEPTREFAEAGA